MRKNSFEEKPLPGLSVYALFHCNLAFSLIDSRDFPSVIKSCYWPILRLAESGLAVAIEMTAWTLQRVRDLDPAFTLRLRELWAEGALDFIGSGHAQCIMPLIPAEVNRWNLELGCRGYEEILGRRPGIALVNEQTYSAGLTGLYKEAGYRAIIMDWNNSARHNGFEKDLLYRPRRAAGLVPGDEVGLLWSHSIGFQKFARAARGEVPMDEYMEYLRSHYSRAEDRAFTAYSNDAEIFDFTPGRGGTGRGDFSRIRRILELIRCERGLELMRPVEIIKKFESDREAPALCLESVETPIVCKKQEKYNPLRWSVTGRDSAHINARCRGLYRRFRGLGKAGVIGEGDWDRMRETLTELWASDFRTNTTDEKFARFNEGMGWLSMETERRMREAGLTDALVEVTGEGTEDEDMNGRDQEANLLCLAGPYIGAGAVMRSGLMPMVQTEETETRLRVCTGAVEIELLKDRGLALGSASFPLVSPEPLIGTISHGHYESIDLGADFFSGHLIQTSRHGRKTTDLLPVAPTVTEDNDGVSVFAAIESPIGIIEKTYRIPFSNSSFTLHYRLRLRGLMASSLRLGIFTLMPEAFQRDQLYYETVNGGTRPERFMLQGHAVSHSSPVSQAISASSCLGATEGWVSMGDNEKKITISSDHGDALPVPMVDYRERGSTFFLRLYHSAGEIDDTSYWVWRGVNELTFKVRAKKHRSD